MVIIITRIITIVIIILIVLIIIIIIGRRLVNKCICFWFSDFHYTITYIFTHILTELFTHCYLLIAYLFTYFPTYLPGKSEFTMEERINKEEWQDRGEPRVVFEILASAVTNEEWIHNVRANPQWKTDFTRANKHADTSHSFCKLSKVSKRGECTGKSEFRMEERTHREERQDREEPRVVFENPRERGHKRKVNSQWKREFTMEERIHNGRRNSKWKSDFTLEERVHREEQASLVGRKSIK